MLSQNGQLLRIFIGEEDKHEGTALYKWLVTKAKASGLAGATVFRASEGYGAHHRIHSVKMLDLSTELPMIIEIVDEIEKVEKFLPIVDAAVKEGLATIEKVEIRLYRSGI